MATAAMFVKPIPIFLAYLVPLDVHVVSKKFKMAAVAMVTKVQTMLNSLRTADPFETLPKNRSSFKVVLFVFKIFVSMATAAILKKNQHFKEQLQIAYDIPTRFHKVRSRHLREK
jgi:hypothetical protein